MEFPDVKFPIAISTISIDDNELEIQYKLSDTEYVQIELEFGTDGEPFVDCFSFIAANG